MNKRPISITIISWIIIILGALSLLIFMSIPLLLTQSDNNTIRTIIFSLNMFAGFIVFLVSGIGMLKGQNWARFIFFIGFSVYLLINFLTSLLGFGAFITILAICFIIFYPLFRPKANEYFAGNKSQSSVNHNSSERMSGLFGTRKVKTANLKTNKLSIIAISIATSSIMIFLLDFLLEKIYSAPVGAFVSPKLGVLGEIIFYLLVGSYLLGAPVNILLGLLSIYSIRKKERKVPPILQRGRAIAWVAIVISTLYFIFPIVVQ